jgi:simple sugar transport system substrate-binding protein
MIATGLAARRSRARTGCGVGLGHVRARLRLAANRAAICVTIALLAATLGCGPATSATSANENGAEPLNVGFVYIGSREDFGYNQAHAAGAAAVRQMPGVQVFEEENVADSLDCRKAMKSMIELDKAKLIFATSFNYFDPHVIRLAREYPKVTFLHCGGLYDAKSHPKNLGTYFGFIDECQYLSGIVAGHMTKSKKLGFVAGKTIPQVRRNINAFALGARSVDPAITVTVIFTGDWSMPVKEAEATNNLIDAGIDVMTCHVNSPKVVVDTAERRGCMTCGYHFNQSQLAPKGYLTGAEWSWDKIYVDYVKAVQEGRPVSGLLRGGLKEGFVHMSPFGPAVTEAAKKRMLKAQARLLDGSLAPFSGPLKDNAGKIVIPAGVRLEQTAVELEQMDYLVEGVIGR